jgi:hypothetical protein
MFSSVAGKLQTSYVLARWVLGRDNAVPSNPFSGINAKH